MKRDTTKEPADVAEGTLFFAEDWFDPLDAGMRIRMARRTFARIRPFEQSNELCARIVMDWPQDAQNWPIFNRLPHKKSWRKAGLDGILAVA